MIKPKDGSGSSFDVAVVGSGPAGASAALALARRGVKTVIVEKARLPRYKTCGGGIVHRAVRLLPLDISKAVESECFAAEMNLLDEKLSFSVVRSNPIVSMTMRETFDHLLVSAAVDAGAELRSECEVCDIEVESNGIVLIAERERIFARFVIAADGAMSGIARKAGWAESRNLIPALEYEVFVGDDLMERFGKTARFDFGTAPYGYGWIFPKRNHLSIGVLSMRRHSINLAAVFERYLKAAGIDRIEKMERHGFVIPVRPRREDLMRGRVMLTGDAAGFADPVTGEGISYAILSGQIAAEALLEGAFDEVRVRRLFHTKLAEKILHELRWGRILAKALYDYPKLRAMLFRRYGQRLSEAVTDLVMGKRTYGEIICNPTNYLKLFTPRKASS